MPIISVKTRLSSACCALLGSSAILAHAHDDTYQAEPWLMNIGLANYIERDRNTGIEKSYLKRNLSSRIFDITLKQPLNFIGIV